MATKKILVTVGGSGAIPELGYICAPIVNPCRLDIDKVSKMVTAGRKVYAVNPNDLNERVLLTASTVYEDVFAKKETPAVAPVANKKVETKPEPVPETKAETKTEPVVEKTEKQEKNYNKSGSKKDKTNEPKAAVTPDASSDDFFKK